MKRSKFEKKVTRLINEAFGGGRGNDYLDGTWPNTEADMRGLAQEFAAKVERWGVPWDKEGKEA